MLSIKITLAAFTVIAAVFVCYVEAGGVSVNNGQYKANWTIIANETIRVVVTANTTGYIGFGINKFPNMTGADLFIGGVFPNGTTYGLDMHGIGNRAPVLDEVQNYELIFASECSSDNRTNIVFSRKLLTGDVSADADITNTEQYILWAIGATDDLHRHATRGSIRLNIIT